MSIRFRFKIFAFILLFLPSAHRVGSQPAGVNDTILLGGIRVNDEVFAMVFIDEVEINSTYINPQRKAELNRLRYNVFKVYPYAITAAAILDKVNKETASKTKKKDRKAYIKTLEKEMNTRFKDELKNLSITQGQILVKLINRQTGRDCYSVIKELKGGLNARIYQTTAFFFENNLKKQYDPYGSDKDIEMIVQEIESKNYYQYQYQLQQKRLAN